VANRLPFDEIDIDYLHALYMEGNYCADAVGELILSRVGVSFLWRRKALRAYGSSPILIRQQHLRQCHITRTF